MPLYSLISSALRSQTYARPFSYQPYRAFVHYIKIVRGVIKSVPLESQPLDIFLYDLAYSSLSDRVSIVITEIAASVDSWQ